MAAIENSIKKLRLIEGGYVNNPADRGKETYCGISRRWYPHWEGWAFIDGLKAQGVAENLWQHNRALQALVDEFYRLEFWERHRLQEVSNPDLCDEIFEMAVNIGHKPAALIVQKALNLLNKCGKLYRDIPEDGQIGPVTVYMLNRFDSAPRREMEALIRTINGLQFEYYKDLAETDPTQEVFFWGWLTRT